MLTDFAVMYRRPMLALMLMLLRPGDYEPAPQYNARPQLSEWDLSHLEQQSDHADALRIVRRIMGAHELTESTIKEQLHTITADFHDASANIMNMDCLTIFDPL